MDGERAYFAGLSGLDESDFSVADHIADAGLDVYPNRAYFTALSGLTPAESYSYSDHRRAVFAGGSVFTPASLPGLTGWWDASDASTFTFGTGSAVAQWRDKSSAARHLDQATALNRPTRDQTINGLPAVKFARLSAQVVSASHAAAVAPKTVWAVVRSDGADTATEVFVGHAQLSLRTTTVYGMDASASLFSAVADTDGTLHFICGVFNNAGDDTLYVDGTTTVGNAGTSAPGNPMNFGLGANVLSTLGGNEFAEHTICESGIYDGELNATQVGQLRAYAQTKWGAP